jgi:YidC/Oxa1 family membrane protein insertase
MLVIANILQPLIDLNEAILKFFHDTVGVGWGLSIIGLTIVIRLAILPLTYKQVRSMQEMQRFSPEMKRIRDRYKDDKQRQNEELMKLYKEHGFNPLGSCLPLVLQLPFFFGLYQTLRSTGFQEEVGNNGQFLFIPDITKPLTGHTPALVFMIVLYVGTQLGSSYVSSLNVQDKNQRRLLFIFPFVFVPVVINFEAGLLLYWVTTNLFTVTQQLAIRKFLPAPEPHPVGGAAGKAKGSDGGPPGRGSRKRPSPKPSGGGDGKQAAGAEDGKGAAKQTPKKKSKPAASSNGQGNGGARKAPPPSPRKKKKRTGRRR